MGLWCAECRNVSIMGIVETNSHGLFGRHRRSIDYLFHKKIGLVAGTVKKFPKVILDYVPFPGEAAYENIDYSTYKTNHTHYYDDLNRPWPSKIKRTYSNVDTIGQ